MKKRILSMIMICLLMVSMVITPTAIKADAASTYTINGAKVRYDDFSSSPDECWVYANNLYKKIWGVQFNNQFSDSSNSLRNLSDSQLTLTKEHLKAYVTNAKLGSVLRICDSQYLHGSDGWGHSQIIVQKDANGFTVFEGGLSASPYCREKYFTWDSYMSTSYLSQYEYIKYIKWPNAPAYSAAHTYTKGAYKWYWDAHPHYKCYQCTMCDEIKEDKSETVKLEGCEQCYPTNVTITFDANGGVCSSDSKTIDIGGKIGALPTPTRDGYIFVGWSSSPKSNYHIVDSTFTYDKDTTLYAHWTSGVYNGQKMDFYLEDGTMPGPISSCSINGYNVPRDSAQLIIYNCDSEYVATNYYGYEVAVNADGYVTAERNYGDNTQLQVPVGGFVVSASGGSSVYVAQIVNDIEVGMYVGYDEADDMLYVYSSNNAYLANHRYIDVMGTYGILPVPSRDGYVFNGWLDPWDGNAGYFDRYESSSLIASWTPEYEEKPIVSREYNGKIYELYDCIMSWEDAQAFCEERGGNLVTITDSAEQQAVVELITLGERGQYYIGATDAASEGTWKWVTGESFSYANWDARAAEPNGGTKANCATIIAVDNPPNKEVGEWNDTSYFDETNTFYHTSNVGFVLERDVPEESVDELYLNIDIGDPSDSFITLYWNSIGSKDSEEYEIYREVNSSGNYEHYANAARVYSFEDSDIEPGNRYRYFVRAYTTDGEIIDSNITGIKYNIDPPVLSAKDIGEGKATLIWNAVEGADHYIVYIDMPWNDPPTNGFEGFIRTTGTSAEVIANLDEIYYKVEAVGYDASITAYSNEVAVQCALPTPQIDIGIDTGNKKPLISWNPIWGTRTFQVQRATSATGSFTSIHTTDINNVYVDETAEAGKTYFYRVKAVVVDEYGAIKYESISEVKSITLQNCIDGHTSQTIPEVAATCEKPGSTEGAKCSVCGTIIVAPQTIPATGHTIKIIPAVPATCTKLGSTEGAECSSCGIIIATPQAIPAIGHTHEIIPAVPATCVKIGSTEGVKCSVCGVVITATKTVPATGHTIKIISAVPATCEAAGSTEGSECSVCGAVITATNIIPAKGHNYTEKVTEATCTEQGYTTYTCSTCGYSYNDNYVDATGHNYVDGECTICGDSNIVLAAPVVKASKVSDDGYITLSWKAVEGADGYRVYSQRPYAEDGDDELELREVISSTKIKVQATPGYTEYYYVVAVNSEGHSSLSTEISTYCDVYAPVGSVKTDTNSGKPVISIEKTWQYDRQYVGFVIMRANSKNSSYITVADCYDEDKFAVDEDAGKVVFVDESAEAGKTYYYKIAVAVWGAFDYDIEKYSAVCSASCKLARPVIKISNVASSGKIKLMWNKVDGAKEYNIYRSTSKFGNYSLMKTTTSTSYTNTTAKAGTVYYYKVRAIGTKSAANSSYSEIKSRTCDLARTTVTLSNVASTGKIKVSWSKVSGAAKYKVYRATSEFGTYSLKKTTTSKTWTDTNTTAGKTYYYKVIAVHKKSAANSADSVIKSRMCDLKAPVVKITTSSGKPKVSWAAVTGAKEYKIYRATSKTGKYSLVKTTTSKSWKDTTAKKGKTYYYKVVAVHKNSSANSDYSNIVYKKCTK